MDSDEWERLFAETPRLSRAVFGCFDPASGAIADIAGYDRAVMEMGAGGHTTGVLLTWAGILACTHADTDDPLEPHLDRIGDPRWRTPAHRHGRALIATCRAAAGRVGGPGLLLQRADRVNRALGNDIWWLIGLLAAATYPVQRDLGGLDRLGEIEDLVQDALRDPSHLGQPGPATAQAAPAAAAGLAAIAHGSTDRAADILGLPEPRILLTVLLPLARQIMRGRRTAAVLTLDDAGLPDTITSDRDNPAIDLVRDVLEAFAEDDPARVRTAGAAITAAHPDDQLLLAWYLAYTLGHHLPG